MMAVKTVSSHTECGLYLSTL